MATLRPFRDYDEKDVINLFSFTGTIPVNRGTLVKIAQGWVSSDEPVQFLGSVAASYNNTQSLRYGAYSKVSVATSGDLPLGILLKDVKETDENGELLKFNPIKAAEMDICLSGQAVPIATKGLFLYSGIVLSTQTPAAGSKLYAWPTGEIATGNPSTGTTVGYCLGGKDTNGCVLIKLDIVAGVTG